MYFIYFKYMHTVLPWTVHPWTINSVRVKGICPHMHHANITDNNPVANTNTIECYWHPSLQQCFPASARGPQSLPRSDEIYILSIVFWAFDVASYKLDGREKTLTGAKRCLNRCAQANLLRFKLISTDIFPIKPISSTRIPAFCPLFE